MNFHLTGRMTASLNNVTVRWHYSSDHGWPSSLLTALDLKELEDKWPQVIAPPLLKAPDLPALTTQCPLLFDCPSGR